MPTFLPSIRMEKRSGLSHAHLVPSPSQTTTITLKCSQMRCWKRSQALTRDVCGIAPRSPQLKYLSWFRAFCTCTWGCASAVHCGSGALRRGAKITLSWRKCDEKMGTFTSKNKKSPFFNLKPASTINWKQLNLTIIDAKIGARRNP